MTKDAKSGEIESFASPTAEDIARYRSMPLSERRDAIAAALQQGIDSGLSSLTPEEIWLEAERRAMAKATT